MHVLTRAAGVSHDRVAIVGAGPAGIAAAGVLAAHGVAPVVIDEGAPAGRADLSAAAAGPAARHRGAARRRGRKLPAHPRGVRRACATASTIGRRRSPGRSTIARCTRCAAPKPRTIDFDALILATGATDRMLPVPGWTLPGVFTLGGAQVLLKEHGCLIGRRIVFCGSFAAALSRGQAVSRHGRRDRRRARHDAVRRQDRGRSRSHGGARHARARPRLHGCRCAAPASPCITASQLRAFEGAAGVEAVRFRDRARNRDHARLRCGRARLRPQARNATRRARGRAARTTIAVFRQWLPRADVDGRCGGSIYLAGDGATVGGAQAAALTGTLAACAVLEDHKIAVAGIDRARARRQVARLRRFQRGLAHAFAWPVDAIHGLDDTVMVCRCEGISAGELRASIRAGFGPTEVNRLKAITRCGMGRCQGRFCGLAAAELTAHTLRRAARSRRPPARAAADQAAAARRSILREMLRPQRAMKPVHQRDHVEHRHAERAR